jgi:hypothetical protein
MAQKADSKAPQTNSSLREKINKTFKPCSVQYQKVYVRETQLTLTFLHLPNHFLLSLQHIHANDLFEGPLSLLRKRKKGKVQFEAIHQI